MIVLIDFAIDMQKRMIAAQEQSLEAMRKSLDGGKAGVAMQQAVEDATKANLKAWDSWMSFWGPRR